MRRTPRKRLIWTVFAAVLLLSGGSALARPRVDVTVKGTLLQSPTQTAAGTVALDRPNAGIGPKHIEFAAELSFRRGQAENHESTIAAVELAGPGKLLDNTASVEIIYSDALIDRLLHRVVFVPVDRVCAAIGDRC